MKHTPEPWKLAAPEGEPPIIYSEDQKWKKHWKINIRSVARKFSREMDSANARRIVACVNACAGVPNDTLDKIAGKEMAGSEFFELGKVIAQRDELLAALKELMNLGEFYSSAIELPRDLSGADLYYKYEALIAKCEAQS